MSKQDTSINTTPDGFASLCRQHGIKATHQRMEIYRELASTEEHPDAETIYTRVRERIPAISLDTVYRTLRLLEEKEIIGRVGPMADRTRYDVNMQHHHHFICTKCGSIKDFSYEQMDALCPPDDVRKMGDIQSVHVEIRGICLDCSKKL